MTRAGQPATTARKKPSLFNRILGVIGELLITAGLIIVLFIVWQIWWTDIEANRAQAQAIEQLQEEYGVITVEEAGIAPRQDGPPRNGPTIRCTARPLESCVFPSLDTTMAIRFSMAQT